MANQRLQHDAEEGLAGEPVGRLLNQCGMYLLGRADFSDARTIFQQALKIDEAAFGPDHPEVAADVNNLGGVLQDLGDPGQAKACYERALKIAESRLGPDHPHAALYRRNLESLGTQAHGR